jgi:hypothetical protein
LVELARKPDADAWTARVRARKRASGSVLSADQIIGYRDADRR